MLRLRISSLRGNANRSCAFIKAASLLLLLDLLLLVLVLPVLLMPGAFCEGGVRHRPLLIHATAVQAALVGKGVSQLGQAAAHLRPEGPGPTRAVATAAAAAVASGSSNRTGSSSISSRGAIWHASLMDCHKSQVIQ
jgi:hypothetical protein